MFDLICSLSAPALSPSLVRPLAPSRKNSVSFGRLVEPGADQFVSRATIDFRNSRRPPRPISGMRRLSVISDLTKIAARSRGILHLVTRTHAHARICTYIDAGRVQAGLREIAEHATIQETPAGGITWTTQGAP